MRENKEEKFIGAYVKDPIVGKYKWIYDLDLTSLYPSIIMTLNISPETIMGKIADWDAEKFFRNEQQWYEFDGERISSENLRRMLDETKCSIASNGVLYTQEKVGCIPDILDHWFNQRVEFRKLEKKYGHEGDKEKYAFYKKRQLVQKILLNSLYGCLGLPAWRFYDRDNAEAVTLTGQVVIKRTADIVNLKYHKELGGIPLLLDMEDGSIVELYPNSLITIKREGIQLNILAKELKESDDFIGKVDISG
jgi:DNA polymerase elongation subunit (family B)